MALGWQTWEDTGPWTRNVNKKLFADRQNTRDVLREYTYNRIKSR